MQNINFNQAIKIAEFIKSEFQLTTNPVAAVILGSGLAKFSDMVKLTKSLMFKDIPGFPEIHIEGHRGRLSLARLDNDSTVLIMEGRYHYYEGHSPATITLPVVVFHLLGIKNLIVSNAAGGINKNFKPGDLMIIEDHINLTGNNPLMGINDNNLGPRFLDQTNPYDPKLIELAKTLAVKCDITAQVGSYLMLSGPAYETKAEIRAFGFMGIDAVGMSTVYEVMMANYLGIKVLGISAITNMGTGLVVGHVHDHQAVINISNQLSDKFSRWVLLILEKLCIN